MSARYTELADAYRTGSRQLSPAELQELDALDAAPAAGAAPKVTALHHLPIFGWAWKGDAAQVERH